MSALKDGLRRAFPRATDTIKAVRSGLQRLRHGDGSMEVFARIAAENYWKDAESLSGGGSNLRQTETLRRELPVLLGTGSHA